MPTALVSKSSKGIVVARSCDGCAAACTIAEGLTNPEEPHAPIAIANVQLVMPKTGQRLFQPPLVPPRVALRAKEDRPLIVVDSMDFESEVVQVTADFRTDQTGRARDEHCFWHELLFLMEARRYLSRPVFYIEGCV